MKNRKATFLGLAGWRDICQEIRIKEITDDQIIFYPGNKRKLEKYDLSKFSGHVIIDGWNCGIDKDRIFTKHEESNGTKWKTVTRYIYDENQAFNAFQDCLKQIQENALQADIINHSAGVFSRNIP